MNQVFLTIWYIALLAIFGMYTVGAYKHSLWDIQKAMPWAWRALTAFAVIILTTVLVSYLK